MALSKTKLRNELQNMVPTSSPAGAAATLATAYAEYMKDAVGLAGGQPIIAAAIDGIAKPAMEAAMTFSDNASASAGAGVFKAGIVAFWATMVAAPGSFWLTATAITAPAFATLQNDLAVKFGTSVTSKWSLATWASQIATTIDQATDGNGTVTFPMSFPTPIT